MQVMIYQDCELQKRRRLNCFPSQVMVLVTPWEAFVSCNAVGRGIFVSFFVLYCNGMARQALR